MTSPHKSKHRKEAEKLAREAWDETYKWSEDGWKDAAVKIEAALDRVAKDRDENTDRYKKFTFWVASMMNEQEPHHGLRWFNKIVEKARVIRDGEE